MYKQMSSGLLKNCHLQTISLKIIYLKCMYKQDLAFNNCQQLICCKTQPTNLVNALNFIAMCQATY